MNAKSAVPWSLTIFRGLLSPAMIAVAASLKQPEAWLGTMIALGFISDVFDGVLARRWHTDTGALRLADSICDDVFYLCLAAVAVKYHWRAIRPSLWILTAVLALEALQILCGWVKYGRMTSYHSYAAKAWGVLLACSAIVLICFDSGSVLLSIALAWGIICLIESLTMTALLPRVGARRKVHRPRACDFAKRMLA